MQADFHYYAAYCAAILAGFSHEDSLTIAYSDQFVDCCSRTYLGKIKAPLAAATTQLQLEMMDMRTDLLGLQNITRIWASFHFLPYDLYAQKKGCSKAYLNKYRLICDSNGALVKDIVKQVQGGSLQAMGIAMHTLCDTWAHKYFAGTPSYVINSTNYHFFEAMDETEDNLRKIGFAHSIGSPDDILEGKYTGSIAQPSENAIMNLGHGRAGHLPDYSYIRYKYMPAWGEYSEITKDNPEDYYHAFGQMVYALKFLNGKITNFELNTYDTESVEPYKAEIMSILEKRQIIASDDWKAFGERLSGKKIEDFEIDKYQSEYTDSPANDKAQTFLGKFIIAAMEQKNLVTERIFESGNLIAGYPAKYTRVYMKRIIAHIKERRGLGE